MSKKIMVFAFLLFVFKIQSQTPFNILFRDSLAFLRTEMLYETTAGFISIGYYDPFDKVGIEITKHDIKTGKVLSRKQFTYKNDWLFTNERTRIYDIDQQLKFAVHGNGKIFQLNYDYVNDTIILADTILNPFKKAFYIYDLEINGDTTTYYAAIGDSLGWVASYPNTPPVFTFVKSTKPRNAGEHFIRAENGNYIFFGGKNDFINNTQRIAITEVDRSGYIIWERETTNNASWSVTDILPVNENEVLILASSFALDQIQGGRGFFHYIYKFNVKDKKFIWQKSFTSPVYSGTNYGQLVKSQRDEDIYFMVNTEYLDGSTIDYHHFV